jgi:hypothetical protein
VNWKDLSADERLALTALLRTLIRLDRTYSDDESGRLHAVAEELGDPESFWETLEKAGETVSTPEQLRALSVGVKRPGARDLVLATLESVAAGDVISGAEQKMVAELRQLWGMPATG